MFTAVPLGGMGQVTCSFSPRVGLGPFGTENSGSQNFLDYGLKEGSVGSGWAQLLIILFISALWEGTQPKAPQCPTYKWC